MWRKGNLLALLVEMQTVCTAIRENSMELPKRVKNRTTLGSSNHTSRYLPKEYKNTNSKEWLYSNVYNGIICNSHIMDTAHVSIDWWIDKEDVIYTHNGIQWNITWPSKKNEILPFAMTRGMELESIMLSEISQRKTNTVSPLICGI